MPGRRIVLTFVALLAWMGTAAAASPRVLDLIPEDAAGAFIIRNLTELKKKGDKFLADADWKMSIRPSQAFEFVYGYLGITGGIDENAPAGILLANPEKLGFKDVGRHFDDLVVVMVSFSDRDKIAANFEIKKGALRPETMVPGKGKSFGKFFYIRGKQLFFGNNEKAVAAIARGKPLSKAMRMEQRLMLGEADMLLHLGAKEWGSEWKNVLKECDRILDAGDAEGKKVARQMVDSLESLRFLSMGVRVDDGLGFNLITVFEDRAGPARDFLTALRGGPGSSDLKGLPEGPVVAAQALRGGSGRNYLVARLLINSLLKNFAETKWIVSVADRPNFVGVFTEVWKRLQGGRLAVYQNTDETRLGLFSMVAILDTADGEKFLGELARMARFAGDVDLSDKTARKDDVAEVERLIRDLGSDEFSERESATTKLCLLGERALPYLNKALKSSDPEVKRRAQDIKDRLVATTETRRKELLTRDVIRPVKPTFAYVSGAEKRDGQRIDVLQVKLSDKDTATAKSLKALFGPDWDKVRLAYHGKQVVALLGSDDKLLMAALKNVKEGKPGLAGSKLIEPFTRRSSRERKAEFHMSVAKVLDLINAEDLRRPAARAASTVTSVSVTVERDRFQVDLWIPSAEFKVMAKNLRW